MSATERERLEAALVDRYRVVGVLGEGGTATVYAADDLRHGRRVAIKVLRGELAAAVGVERFLAEIATTARLQHPNILPLFDSGEAGGSLYFVMPLVEGESLRDRLEREGQLPVEDAVRIATSLADALDYAHRQGVVHRDIKPGNVLLRDGRPVISDFGIALASGASGDARLTTVGVRIGTPTYMSPEQATGDQPVGPRTDVYALGCVLHEMLLGEPPHVGSTPQAIVGRIVSGETGSLRIRRGSVPPHVDGVVLRALEKLPADRFATAADFGRALADASFRHGPAVGPEEARAERGLRGRGAGPWAVALAATVVALVALRAALRGPAEEGARGWRVTVTLPTDVTPAPGIGAALTVSPDGRTIVWVGRSEDGVRLYRRRLDRFVSDPVAGTEGAQDPFFSPDGAWIAFFAGGNLERVPSAGGEVQTLVSGLGSSARGGFWSEDGSIYIGAFGAGVRRVSASGGVPEVLTTLSEVTGEVGHFRPVPIAGGSAILYTAVRGLTTGVQSIEAIDLGTRRVQHVADGAYDPRWSPGGRLLYADEGGVVARDFDARALTAVGPPIRVLDDVALRPSAALADYALSPTGLLAYVPAAPVASADTLEWVDRSGRATPILAVPGAVPFAALSPAADRAAITVFSDDAMGLWMVDLARAVLSPLDIAGYNHIAVWIDGGARVVYSSDRSGGSDLYARSADGTGESELLFSSRWHKDPGSWSAAERTLAFVTAGEDTGADIWLHQVGASPEARPFLRTAANETSPTVSRDSRWLAFVSDRTGRAEVDVTPFPDGGPVIQLSTDGGNAPRWSPDGRELYFVSDSALWTVDVRSLPAAPERPRRLFRSVYRGQEGLGAPAYDVAPDGTRFLMVRAGAVPPRVRELRVVGDFLDEVRARMRR